MADLGITKVFGDLDVTGKIKGEVDDLSKAVIDALGITAAAAGKADKWTTARTLSLTGDVTGSTTWDGSGNASITATVGNDSHSHSTYLPLSGGTMTGAIHYDDTAFTTNIDCSLGNSFSKTVTGNFTQTFSNVPASGNACVIVIKLTNAGAFTITWPTSIKWANGTAPTFTASGTDTVVLYTISGGTTWYGNANIGYA